MAIDPSWFQTPDVGGNVMRAFEAGQQKRKQEVAQNALAAYATNPNDQTLNALAPHDPGFVIQQRQTQAKQQADAQAKQREDIMLMGKLLRHGQQSPEAYQQARQAASHYGINVANVPEQYDPNWIQQNIMLVDAFEKDGGEAFSNAGKQAIDMGYKPGTPQYSQAVQQIVVAGLSKPYTGSQGETRLYQPEMPALTGTPAPSAPKAAGEALTQEQYQGLVNGLGEQGAQAYLKRQGVRAVVRTGTDKSGRRVVQYSDGTIDYGN